ncbi:MAG: ATP-binding cassette domain-containing protein [Flaviflexus sp.]|uniref:ABC transporter ATP-binding protein n=1 Tax=Flaviflexus sp. TaxID=1969482 RepID=UPI00352F3C79
MTTTSDTFHPNMSSTPDYLYQLTDVERTYYLGDHKVEALKGVNLTFREGEFATIQGPTGGGKSTLLQLLGGLDRPTTGTVMLRDINLGQAPSSALTKIRAEQIGFVFQSFNLLQTLTASQNVDVALEGRGLSKAERAERVTYALHRVGLAERADHRQGELSGGQQQRVAIARAIVATPSLLLADGQSGRGHEGRDPRPPRGTQPRGAHNHRRHSRLRSRGPRPPTNHPGQGTDPHGLKLPVDPPSATR